MVTRSLLYSTPAHYVNRVGLIFCRHRCLWDKQICVREGERRDLNPRPLEPQSRALPTELRPPHKLYT